MDTRVIWENFCYKFAGKTYKQSTGGPIGARVTMCAARLIMQDWGERYKPEDSIAKQLC